MQRREFLKTVGIGAASVVLAGCQDSHIGQGMNVKHTKRRKHPNIIYILADDLGYGDLGCYGQKKIKTPHLDEMAREGMLFTQHYAGSTVCAPSRCTLMTGLHTGHCWVRGNADGTVGQTLQPNDVTVAELLKKAGYTTALIGKWGLGQKGSTGFPLKQGFDYFYGYLNQAHAHNYYPDFLWRNEEKVKLRNIVKHKKGQDIAGVSSNKLDYSPDFFIKEALDFIKQNKDKPFFLYFASTLPHANNEAGKKGMEIPDYGIYKDKKWPEAQKGHAAMITHLDSDVGKIMSLVISLGLDKDTIIMFASDNGPHREGGNNPDFNDSNGPLRGIKRDLYEGGVRVPFIARWPGKIKAGSRSDLISAFWDILPTCADIAGVKVPRKIDGISLRPTLLSHNKKQKRHEYLYWEFHERQPKQAVHMNNWKAIRFLPNRIELYNLKNDLGETNNLAEKNPHIVKMVENCMNKARTPSKHWPFKKGKKK